MWLWIAVILAVGVVSVFIFYFALPPKKNGFASGTGYQYMLPGTKGKSRIILIKSKINLIKERLKKALEKIRQKFKRKQTAQSYSYKGNQSALTPFIYKGPPLE